MVVYEDRLNEVLHLPADFGDRLDLYVRVKYRELGETVQSNPRES